MSKQQQQQKKNLKLTPRQSVAFARPCYVAEDTTAPRFRWTAVRDGRLLSFLLTANVGLE